MRQRRTSRSRNSGRGPATSRQHNRVHTFVPQARAPQRGVIHSDPRYLHFWTIAVNDLALNDTFISFAFVRQITDVLGKPLLSVGNGETPHGFMRYRYGKGYDIQILDGLSTVQELLTTLHELRHVAQHRSKQWSGWTWNGVRIPKYTPYRKLPWEHDAEMYAYQRLYLIAKAAGYDIDNEL